MKKIKIIKSRPLKEEEEVIDQVPQDTAPEQPEITYESNPLEFMLQKYPTLTKTLVELLTDDFRNYIVGVYIMAPKPTIFKIVLHNNRSFHLIFMGDDKYEAKVSGKKYWLSSIDELERATISIAELLMMGTPPTTQGPETEMTSAPEEASAEETPTETPEETPAEETPEELAEGKLGIKITEAGAKFERQERGLVKAIKSSPKKPAILVVSNKTIPGVKNADKEEITTAAGKEPMTDVYLETTKGRINLSLKGPSAPSLAGGGVKGIETVNPTLITDFFKKAKAALSKEYKKGENIPDVYMPLDKKTAEALIRSNEESGGPIDYIYKGPMDVKAEYKGNQIIISDATLLTPSEMATKYPLYLRYRKRREDQRFDPNSPSLLTQSKKGDKNGRLVVTDNLPSTALVIK